MLRTYYKLAKPGIVYGNLVAAVAGFLLASRGKISFKLLVAMVIGLGLVIGGSAVFNNYLDRDIDAKMERTKDRPSVTGKVSFKAGFIYGSCLLVVGLFILYWYTNPLTLIIALIGVIFYLFLYSPLKRLSMYSPLVGSIAGAVPPLVGFCTVTNTFNVESLILFLIFVTWQMPHFYAIAIYKHDDYAAASIPTLPLKKGMVPTRVNILLYIIAFIFAAASLTILGFTGYIYLAIVFVLGLIWLSLGLTGFCSGMSEADEDRSARKLFLFSLVVMVGLCVALSIGSLVP